MTQTISGYDANALYLWALMQEMPTGYYAVRRASNNFRRETRMYYSKVCAEWLDYLSVLNKITIDHYLNTGYEKRIGPRRLPVDGWCAEISTVFDSKGCRWHRHEASGCCSSSTKSRGNDKVDPKKFQAPEVLLKATVDKETYLRECGLQVIAIWECEWSDLKKEDARVREFILKREAKRPKAKLYTTNVKQITEAVQSGDFFGFIQCDIHVPLHLKAVFEEMTPIFKNATIKFEDIGPFMQNYMERNNISKNPRRSLIGSYKGDGILLASPLLSWYLNHGLVVTDIQLIIEYEPAACFRNFGDQVSTARRQGDFNPDHAILAETFKLQGNSSYGKTLENKKRHRDLKYCDESKADELINSPLFSSISHLNENVFEIESFKKKISLDLPIQIGLWVYNMAKLKMLQFAYDLLKNYINPADYEYCEMDTDSAYLALNGVEDRKKTMEPPTMLSGQNEIRSKNPWSIQIGIQRGGNNFIMQQDILLLW
ncbi:hypothetical protein CAPTEDRAFT_198375 [Capitella teleta]|uniref:DNA-directed DNA polymerase n=1 Tax=Capitella teleta TaxID=283909 RepID=R7T8F2_CAPTE|nr:hypothetical protein CAPTEDRAFT_198375 [Capitella teleta]|eukprot:ELT89959.1 hypothetical protein CAPTEDRAFT_198375 [Capitella teleta]